jgi:hypothetical protein
MGPLIGAGPPPGHLSYTRASSHSWRNPSRGSPGPPLDRPSHGRRLRAPVHSLRHRPAVGCSGGLDREVCPLIASGCRVRAHHPPEFARPRPDYLSVGPKFKVKSLERAFSPPLLRHGGHRRGIPITPLCPPCSVPALRSRRCRPSSAHPAGATHLDGSTRLYRMVCRVGAPRGLNRAFQVWPSKLNPLRPSTFSCTALMLPSGEGEMVP